MDLQLVKRYVFYYTQKRKRWVAFWVALGFSSYGVYRIYHLPSIAQERKQISKLLGVLFSVAEVVSDSAETIGIITKDLKDFVQSESDQIPNSLKQISKVTRSSEFSDSVISLTQALTMGILSGYRSSSSSRLNSDDNANANPSFFDKVFDKLSSPAGSGFVSVIVGSFARNLVMSLYQGANSLNSSSEFDSASADDDSGLGMSDSVTKFVDIVCDRRCKELIGDCVQLFVSTAVAVYLDKTMHINTYDEIFAGLTNPKHEKEVSNVLVSVCNGAIQTLVKTSHEVLTNSETSPQLNSPIKELSDEDAEEEEKTRYSEPKRRKSIDKAEDGEWFSKVSSSLAVPSNRKLVLDLTGRVTFETIRSVLEFLVEKLSDGIRRCVNSVHQAVVESGLGIVRFVRAKTSVVVTVCLSLCLHILDSSWIMVPA